MYNINTMGVRRTGILSEDGGADEDKDVSGVRVSVRVGW